MAFKIRYELVEDIKANFKSKHKRQGGEEALLCKDCACKEIQTQSHCLVCPEWEEIRTGLELDKMEDLVQFFQKLLVEQAKRKKSKKSKTGSEKDKQKERLLDLPSQGK